MSIGIKSLRALLENVSIVKTHLPPLDSDFLFYFYFFFDSGADTPTPRSKKNA